jgi:hypothetical protein
MSITRKLGCLVLSALVLTAAQAATSSSPSSASKASLKSNGKSAVKPAVRTGSHKSDLEISFSSGMRQGNLVVSLDGVPIFNEQFKKPVLLFSQTTTWDPVPVNPGKHRLTAKVYGTKGKAYLSADYDLVLSQTKKNALLIKLKGEKLTVEPAS